MEDITVNDKVVIEAARAAYDALTDDQKALVTNLDKLTAAETALAAAEKLFPQHSITLGGVEYPDGITDSPYTYQP